MSAWPPAGADSLEIAGQPVARHFGDPAGEYAAALNGLAIAPRQHAGRLLALGRDRLDLLHRMSTNDLNSLPPGQARPTVLITAIARILDLVWVLNRGETAVLVTSPGQALAVRRWLSGYIFFRDQVKLEDHSAALAQADLCGPQAGALVETWWPGAGGLALNHFLEQDGLLLWRVAQGYTVIAPAEKLAPVWERAVAAGARPLGEDAFQWLRLRAGQPYTGHELTEDYIPLEADLWPAVSFKKGCYIGQEIIARLESRGKLARRLTGLRLAAPAPEGAEVRLGETVLGRVTTAGELPDLGPLALAYLKIGQAEPGVVVQVGETSATVAPLPFVA